MLGVKRNKGRGVSTAPLRTEAGPVPARLACGDALRASSRRQSRPMASPFKSAMNPDYYYYY